ncbi:hypothetical protein, partial [Rhizobium sp. Leaf311]|uniref:hypothetical protein n=1 Tax=Rhizobium sp. Leaf311 TaxID=1736332 RepID=UPI00138F3F9E
PYDRQFRAVGHDINAAGKFKELVCGKEMSLHQIENLLGCHVVGDVALRRQARQLRAGRVPCPITIGWTRSRKIGITR